MTGWTDRVQEPFRDDPRFWSAVAGSVDALLALVLALVLFVLVPGPSALAFLVPVALLVVSWRIGRVSSARSRASFATEDEWRLREREAVAAALPGAFVRRPPFSSLVRR